VVVHALAFDFETDTRLKVKFPEKKTLTINNIESFYNYKTIGDQFQLATSVLSELDLVKIIPKSKSDKRSNELVIVKEIPLSDSSVHLNTILAKKQRINAALLQIKRNSEEGNLFNDNLTFFHLILNQKKKMLLLEKNLCFVKTLKKEQQPKNHASNVILYVYTQLLIYLI
jgi:hypothetical protein